MLFMPPLMLDYFDAAADAYESVVALFAAAAFADFSDMLFAATPFFHAIAASCFAMPFSPDFIISFRLLIPSPSRCLFQRFLDFLMLFHFRFSFFFADAISPIFRFVFSLFFHTICHAAMPFDACRRYAA